MKPNFTTCTRHALIALACLASFNSFAQLSNDVKFPTSPDSSAFMGGNKNGDDRSTWAGGVSSVPERKNIPDMYLAPVTKHSSINLPGEIKILEYQV